MRTINDREACIVCPFALEITTITGSNLFWSWELAHLVKSDILSDVLDLPLAFMSL